MTITPNPGLILLAAAAAALFLPGGVRAWVMVAAALGAIVAGFTPDFGQYDAIRRIGLDVVPLRLDSLSQVFGLGLGLAALVLFLAGADRRRRLEDAALAAHAGGAIAAVYAGDLVTLVAGAQTAALAGAALVFLAGGEAAQTAARRAFGWFALAGAVLTAGVGAVWAETGGVAFDRLPDAGLGPLLVGAGLLVLAGAPPAHVWLQAAVARAGWVGSAALMVFLPKLAVYALLRTFPSAPALLWVGAAMVALALPMALACRDPRRAMGYGAIAQTGALVAAASLASPLAIAGVAALAFSQIVATLLVAIAVGAAMERAGGSGPLWRTAPVAAVAATLGALTALGAPGTAGFAPLVLVTDAAAQADAALLWLVQAAGIAGAAAHLGAHVTVSALFARAPEGRASAALPFHTLLALLVLGVFAVAIGAAPGWLLSLAPGEVAYEAFAWGTAFAHLQIIAVGLCLYALFAVAAARIPAGDAAPVDLDAFIHGPLARAGGWLLLAAASGYARGKTGTGALLQGAWRRLAGAAGRLDRPGAPGLDTLAAAAAAIGALGGLLFWLTS